MINVIFFYVCFLIVFVLYTNQKFNVLLLLFIVLFNSNLDFIFGDKGEFLGIVNFVEVIEIFLLLLLYKKISVRRDKQLKTYNNIVLLYIVISFVFNIYYYYKVHLMLWDDGSYYTIIRRFLKFSLLIYLFVLLAKNFNRKEIYRVVDKAIVIFAIFYSFSSIIYFSLYNIGIDMARTFDSDTRTSGIFVGGDSNHLAATLSMCFGYFMAQIEKKRYKKSYYLAAAFIVFGIIETGSRGGMLGFAGVLLLFLFRNRNIKNYGIVLILLISTSIILYYWGDRLIDRFFHEKTYNPNLDYDPNKYGGANLRFYKWGVYVQELIKNPNYLWLGATEPRPFWIYYNVHNVFLVMLYYGGFIFFTLYSFIILKIFTIRKSNKPGAFNLLYVLIPFFIMLMELNDWFYFILPIMILQSYGYFESSPNKSNGLTLKL